MVDASTVLSIADSHLVLHLLGPGEADVAQEPDGGSEQGAAESGDAPEASSASSRFLPDNLVEDFLDEAVDMFDEVSGYYEGLAGWEKPLVFGFVDGVLAVADDSWSALEDSYYADARNAEFTDADAAIDQLTGEFEGSRPWDEAAKGYIRDMVARARESSAFDQALLATFARGFIYGADAAYDQEWKVVVTPANNLLLTDEDSISEAALAQMEEESGSRSLLDRVFDMMGIDPDELAAAIGDEDDAEGNAEDDTASAAESRIDSHN